MGWTARDWDEEDWVDFLLEPPLRDRRARRLYRDFLGDGDDSEVEDDEAAVSSRDAAEAADAAAEAAAAAAAEASSMASRFFSSSR